MTKKQAVSRLEKLQEEAAEYRAGLKKVHIYLGGPLFSEMDQDFNAKLAKRLREEFGDKIELYSPQENEAINDKSGYANSVMIAEGDTIELLKSDILIANLDGAVIDPGLASEIGVFFTLNRPVIGLYTDVRQGTYGNQQKIDALDEVAESQFSYTNLYTVGLVKMNGVVVQSSDALVEKVRSYVGSML